MLLDSRRIRNLCIVIADRKMLEIEHYLQVLCNTRIHIMYNNNNSVVINSKYFFLENILGLCHAFFRFLVHFR